MNSANSIKQLLHRISEDDSAAFTELFDLYFSKVLRFAGFFIKTDDIRQEVTSDVFLNIWNNRKNLNKIVNFDSFVFIVTKNKAFDYLDKLGREPDYLSELSADIYSGINNPEAQLISTELEQILNKAIEELPARCKMVYMMSREDGLKYHEIAEMMSISERTVNAQMVIAVKKIGEAIRKYMLLF
ncbi:MAG TPA: RNA polymerase sigma-70 factor [Bacteroidales bacterium]|nr:RNA polymerase sigma-70 factor [Bacteroidales bacterium]